MPRGDQLSRQWKIIQSLMSATRGKSAAELADALGCHSRTVYRDLEALQTAGFPLFVDKFEGRTLWSILDSGHHQMPIPLNLTELMALHFSRNMLKSLEGSAIHDSLATLFEKVKSTLPDAYVNYLAEMEKSLDVGIKAHKTYRHFQQTLSAVQEAVQRQCHIDIQYYTMSRNETMARRVAPYKVWFYDETFYLIGYCALRKNIRLFAVDRIEKIEMVDDRFDIPDGFDAEAYMQPSFGVFQGEPVTVRIRFKPEAAGYVKEKIWHPSQTCTREPDGGLLFSAQVAGTQEIKIWIMKWGSAAQVLEPESLRTEIAQEAQDMIALYAQDE